MIECDTTFINVFSGVCITVIGYTRYGWIRYIRHDNSEEHSKPDYVFNQSYKFWL